MTASAPARRDDTATSPGRPAAPGGRAAGLWHGGWALATATGAGVVLACLGLVPPRALTAMVLGVAPGVLGFFYRPVQPGRRVWVLGAWTACTAVAMAATGGVSGPLAVWSLAPLLAALAYGGLWREAAGQAFAAVVAVAVIQAGGRAGAPLADTTGLALGLMALVTTLGGAAAGLMMRLAGDREDPALDIAPTAPALEPSTPPEAEARLAAAEAARDAAEADARGKMRFLANVSHELRTPLNAIMGFSDIMRSKLFGDLSPRYAEYAELIHEGGAHLLDLINDVLDVSKIEADKYVLSRELFDAREVVQAMLRLMRQQADDAGVQLRAVLPAEPLEVDADRRALKQIVLNLVSNALKFTPAGGSVNVTLAAAAGAIEIAVADTGVGVAPEDLERLGRPYEQAGEAVGRGRGTGLGLSLVKAFAALHGGEMTLESRLGEGTAVSVRLPVLAAEPSQRATAGAKV